MKIRNVLLIPILLILILQGGSSKSMTIHKTEPFSLNPMAGIIKGPYEIQDESGKSIGVKVWTEGEIKEIKWDTKAIL